MSTPPGPPPTPPPSPDPVPANPRPAEGYSSNPEPGGLRGLLKDIARKPVASAVTGVIVLAGWVRGKQRRR